MNISYKPITLCLAFAVLGSILAFATPVTRAETGCRSYEKKAAACHARISKPCTTSDYARVRWAPGFLSASLHRSIDGTKVTMYAQWRSIDHYQVRQDPSPLTFLEEALKIAKFEPGVYEVVQTFAPIGEAS